MQVVKFVRTRTLAGAAAAAIVLAFGSISGVAAALELQSDGDLAIDGRRVSCKSDVRTVLDAKLPNLGIATRRLLVLNPQLLSRQSPTVRLFVYHHECGHHHVGGDELGADCWAVRAGVADGWLHAPQLNEICRSFGNAKATAAHPAAQSRCQALRACFADALKAPKPDAPATPAARPEVAQSRTPLPRLVREGFSAAVDAPAR